MSRVIISEMPRFTLQEDIGVPDGRRKYASSKIRIMTTWVLQHLKFVWGTLYYHASLPRRQHVFFWFFFLSLIDFIQNWSGAIPMMNIFEQTSTAINYSLCMRTRFKKSESKYFRERDPNTWVHTCTPVGELVGHVHCLMFASLSAISCPIHSYGYVLRTV